MNGGFRINIEGIEEATKQLQGFDKMLQDFAKSGGVSQINVDSLVKQISQRMGGLDVYRSPRDLDVMRGAVSQGSVAYKGKAQDASEAIKVLENSIQEATKDLAKIKQAVKVPQREQLELFPSKPKDLERNIERRDNIQSMIQEMSVELKDYNEQLQEASNALEIFNKVVNTVSEENRQITSGARSDTAPQAERKLGTLEKLNIKTARNQNKLMRASSRSQRNLYAYRNRENIKQAQDIYSDKMLTTNQRAVYTPAFQGVNTMLQGVGAGVGGSFNDVVNLTTGIANDAREIFTLDIPKAIGAAITMSTNAVSRYAQMVIPRGVELEDATQDASRVTGTNIQSITGGNMSGLYNMGLNTAEANRAMISIARSIGTSGQNTSGLMQAEFGAGLEQGGFQPVLQGFKYYSDQNKSGADAMQRQIAEMVGILDNSQLINAKAGDFTRMGEAVQLVSQVDAMQAQRANNVDLRTSAGVVAGLERIGGTFRGEAGMAKFQQIDRGITTPDNQFKEAVVLRALMESDPNMSMRELRKRQQMGATDPRNFDAVMKKLQDMSGAVGTNEDLLKSDLFVENVSKMFTGGMIEPAEALIRSRSKEGNYDVFAPKLGLSVATAGRGQRSGIISATKELDDEIAKQGTMANPYVKSMIESSTRFVRDPMKELDRLKDEGLKSSKEALGQFWNGMGTAFTEMGKGAFNFMQETLGVGISTPKKAQEAFKSITEGKTPTDAVLQETKTQTEILKKISENTKQTQGNSPVKNNPLK